MIASYQDSWVVFLADSIMPDMTNGLNVNGSEVMHSSGAHDSTFSLGLKRIVGRLRQMM